jgi:hypothetical protein
MTLDWLGMSGKPAWDSKFFKKPGATARTDNYTMSLTIQRGKESRRDTMTGQLS